MFADGCGIMCGGVSRPRDRIGILNHEAKDKEKNIGRDADFSKVPHRSRTSASSWRRFEAAWHKFCHLFTACDHSKSGHIPEGYPGRYDRDQTRSTIQSDGRRLACVCARIAARYAIWLSCGSGSQYPEEHSSL